MLSNLRFEPRNNNISANVHGKSVQMYSLPLALPTRNNSLVARLIQTKVFRQQPDLASQTFRGIRSSVTLALTHLQII